MVTLISVKWLQENLHLSWSCGKLKINRNVFTGSINLVQHISMSSLHGTWCAKMFPCPLWVMSTSSDIDVHVSFSLSKAIKVSDILSHTVVNKVYYGHSH
jgi:hypothetical protein